MSHFQLSDLRLVTCSIAAGFAVEAVEMLPLITDFTKLVIQIGIGGLTMWFLYEKIKHLKRQK